MAHVTPLNLPFDEAVKWFKAKNIVSRAEFDQMDKVLKARAFTAAYVHEANLLQEVYNAVLKGVADGESYHEVSHLTEGILTGSWHRETVFRTNTLAAYGLGHFQQAQSLAKLRPWVRYTAIMDMRTRPAHARLHGATFRMDDPGIAEIWPPIGYNCRCSMYTLSDDEAKDLPISKVSDPELPGADPGFSSPAHGGFFDAKTGKWSEWLKAQVSAEMDLQPEIDPSARAAVEVTPWDYKGEGVTGEVPQARIPIAEDLGIQEESIVGSTLKAEEWDPDLELEIKTKPKYTSIEVPPGKFYNYEIPGIKQIEIAEEDLFAGLEGKTLAPGAPAAEVELTTAEKAWIKHKAFIATDDAIKNGSILEWQKNAYYQKAVEDGIKNGLFDKANGKVLQTLGITDTLKVDAAALTPGEKGFIDKKITGHIADVKKTYGAQGQSWSAQYWKDLKAALIDTEEKQALAKKAAGEVIPTLKKVSLTASEKKVLDLAIEHYVDEKLADLGITIADKTTGQYQIHVELAKKKLTATWTQRKAQGTLDDLLAEMKAKTEGLAKLKAEKLALEAETWAQGQVVKMLADYPADAQPTSDFVNGYKENLKKAFIKKGGVPSEMLSSDAAVGISKAADPLAPKDWKVFTSREPAHNYGMTTWEPWRKSLTGDEFQAVRAYKGSGYVPINKWLRAGGGAGSYNGVSVKSLVNSMDRAFQKGAMHEPVKIFRGLSMKLFNDHGVSTPSQLPKLKGTIIRDKGFPSAGLTERSAWAHKGVLWEIRCPPGTPAAYLETISQMSEYEILLGRGLRYKVLDVQLDYDWGGRKVPKVISEVIL